jgi:hypothetical protein
MDEINGYFDDDGNQLNPDLIPKPGLYLTCIKDNDPNEEIPSNLNRLDQRDQDNFVCYAYEKIK